MPRPDTRCVLIHAASSSGKTKHGLTLDDRVVVGKRVKRLHHQTSIARFKIDWRDGAPVPDIIDKTRKKPNLPQLQDLMVRTGGIVQPLTEANIHMALRRGATIDGVIDAGQIIKSSQGISYPWSWRLMIVVTMTLTI